MQSLAVLLTRLARRHRLQGVLTQMAPPLVVSAVVAAVAVAAVRWAMPEAAWLVSALVIGGLGAPLVWLPSAWQMSVSASRLAAELDSLAEAQGLVMAYAECHDPAWHEHCQAVLMRVTLPRLPWRPLLPGIAAVLLLLGAIALPQAVVLPAMVGPADALVKPLREQLAELAATGVLTHEEHDEMNKRLADLVARSQGGVLDQATWEGIDRVQTQAAAQATAAGEKLAAALTSATASAATVSAATVSAATSELPTPAASDPAAANALAAQVAVDLARLAEQAPGLASLDLADPHARAALAAALESAQQKGLLSKAQVAALQRAGLTSGKASESGTAAPTAAQSRALAQQLADELDKRKKQLGSSARTAAEAFLARLAAQQAGSGAPTPGPGEAPIEQLARLRTAGGEQAPLAPGVTLNPDGSVTIAAHARDAQLDGAARADLQRAAARAFDPTAADSRRAHVAPRHRAAVAAYFSEPAK